MFWRNLWPRKADTANPQQVEQPAPKLPFPSGYTVATWRKNDVLVKNFAEFQREALYQHILSVLLNGIPSGYPQRGNVINETMAAVELGRMQGYLDCLNLFQSLSRTTPEPVEVPQDYDAELKD